MFNYFIDNAKLYLIVKSVENNHLFLIKNSFIYFPNNSILSKFNGNLNEMDKLPKTFKKYDHSIYVWK